MKLLTTQIKSLIESSSDRDEHFVVVSQHQKGVQIVVKSMGNVVFDESFGINKRTEARVIAYRVQKQFRLSDHETEILLIQADMMDSLR